MNQLELHPFAAQIEFVLDVGISAELWKSLLKVYFKRLAHKSAALENTVIGHIKGFAILPDGGYIQISVVSPSHPATVTLQDGTIGGYRTLSLTLNYLVYGLPINEAEFIVQDAAQDLMEETGGQVIFKRVSDSSLSDTKQLD